MDKGFLKLGSLSASPSRLNQAWDQQTPGPMHSLQLSAHTPPIPWPTCESKHTFSACDIRNQTPRDERASLWLHSPPQPCPAPVQVGVASLQTGVGGDCCCGLFQWPAISFSLVCFASVLFFFSFLLCSVPVLIIHSYLSDCPQVSFLTFPTPNPVP